MWARTQEEAAELEQARENLRRLPGAAFPPGMRVTASLEEAISEADMVAIVVPSRSLRENVRGLLPYANPAPYF